MNKIAKQLGLKYIGSSNWTGNKLYYFNDPETKTTLVVKDIENLKSHRDKSRRKFKGE